MQFSISWILDCELEQHKILGTHGFLYLYEPVVSSMLHTQPRAKRIFCVAAHPHSVAAVHLLLAWERGKKLHGQIMKTKTKITILEAKIKSRVLIL